MNVQFGAFDFAPRAQKVSPASVSLFGDIAFIKQHNLKNSLPIFVLVINQIDAQNFVLQ